MAPATLPDLDESSAAAAASQILASVPFFRVLSPEQLAPLAARARRRFFQERDVIVRRGDPGDALYIVYAGKVKVCYSDEEKEKIIEVLSAGELFGELSVFDGEPRSADVVALEPTWVLVLSGEDLNRSIAEVPGVAQTFLRELAARLRRATGQIWSVSLDVHGRIAWHLLHLARSHGADAPGGGRRILVRLTQNDLANIVSASRESVNKAIGYYKQKGYITVDTTYHITVHNRQALEKRCQQ